MIKPRRIVQDMQPYGAPEEGRRDFIRMDFNENTIGFPECCPEDLPMTWVNAYPEYQTFLNQLAQSWDLPENALLLTNGSDEGLSVIAATFIEPGIDTALISRPTFSMIPHYLRLAGANLEEVPVTRELTFDLKTLEEKLTQGVKLAIFASPDNPTGAVIPPEQVADWCQRFPDTLFTLDEAYAEYSDQSVLSLVARYDNLLVTRTFSKAWGMAGVRLGVVVGNPALIELMGRVRSPYSVNSSAVWAAGKLLKDKDRIYAEARAAMARKDQLMQAIQDRGYRIYPGHANFFLLAAGIDAQRLTAFFREYGILIRNRSTSAVPNGDPLWGLIRVSVGSDAENQKFLDCLDAYQTSHALIFDMDDTLVDTSKSFDVTVATLVEQHSGQPLDMADLKSLRAEGGFNDDWDATVELLKRRGVTVSREQIAEEGRKIYFALAPDNETLMMEPALLERLKKRYRLFIVTGRYRHEYEPLWAKDLDPHYEEVCCRDDVEGARPKPSPDHLLAVMQKHTLQNGFYVGNSVDDMTSSSEAGLVPLGVQTTHASEILTEAGALCVVASVNELGKVFQL